MCRVTLGDVGKGVHGLRRPPAKNGKHGQLYDSVGNGAGVYLLYTRDSIGDSVATL
jgi:hypothetical protein